MVQVLSGFAELRALAPQLWQDDAQVDFFLTAQWFELLGNWGVPQGGRISLLLMPEVLDGPCVCLPLWTPSPGAHMTGLSNFYSSLFGYVGMRDVSGVHAGDSAGASTDLTALGAALAKLPDTAVLSLQPLALDQPFLFEMEVALRRAGFWVDRFFCFGNWYLPCAGLAFTDYLAARGSQLRNNLNRGRRRLAKAGTWEVELVAGAGLSLPRLEAEFAAVYAGSWKPAEARPEFIGQLMGLAAAQGWLRLGVLRLNGEAIAAQLWLVKAGRASIYKLAYREGYESFSAGSILTAALMQHVLDVDEVTEVDYLTGDDAYKRDWMTHRRERWGLIGFDTRRWRGWVAALRHFGGVALRRLAHRLVPSRAV